MKNMAGPKGSMPRELQKRIEASKANNKPLGEAELRLFLLYWRRPQTWDRCLALVDFAPFLDAMRKNHPGSLIDRKRVNLYVSLPEWERLVEHDEYGDWMYPLAVWIRVKGKKFDVAAYCRFNNVKAELRESVLVCAKKLQEGKLAGNRKNSPTYLEIRRESDLSEEGAVDATLRQIELLQKEFSALLPKKQ